MIVSGIIWQDRKCLCLHDSGNELMLSPSCDTEFEYNLSTLKICPKGSDKCLEEDGKEALVVLKEDGQSQWKYDTFTKEITNIKTGNALSIDRKALPGFPNVITSKRKKNKKQWNMITKRINKDKFEVQTLQASSSTSAGCDSDCQARIDYIILIVGVIVGMLSLLVLGAGISLFIRSKREPSEWEIMDENFKSKDKASFDFRKKIKV